MSPDNLAKLAVGLTALHSLILGALLLAFPGAVLGLFGWQYDCSSFFPAQSGLFLVLLGGAYLAGLWYRPFVWFLVATKVAAVVFLVSEVITDNCPTIVLLQGVVDGLMGTAVTLTAFRQRKGAVAYHHL